MPTIDKLYLLKILLIVLLFAGLLFGVHAFQSARIPDALKRQAERAVEAEKYDSAIRYLRQYLEFRKDDIEAREKLTELLRTRGGDARTPLRMLYDEILRVDPSRDAIRLEAAKLALSMSRFSDAEGHAEQLLKQKPKDAELWQLLAQSQMGLRKFEKAQKSLESALKNAPSEPLPYQLLAQLLWKELEQPDAARAIIDRMVESLPNRVEPRITRAKFILRSDTSKSLPSRAEDAVLTDLDAALAIAPSHAEALLLKAERLQRHRDVSGAQAALIEGIRHHPSNVRLVRSLAWLELNRGNSYGAISVLEESLPHVRESLEVLIPLADLLLQIGDVQKTEEIVRKLEKRSGKSAKLPGKYLRARLLMREQKWEEAIEQLIELRTASIELAGLETQANLLLSSCYQRRGDFTKEIESLKLITAKEPNHTVARSLLGTSYLNAGQVSEALREYELAMQSPGAGEVQIQHYTQLRLTSMLTAGASAEAWNKFDRWLIEMLPRFGANRVEWTLLRAEVSRAAGELTRAKELVRDECSRLGGDERLAVKWCELETESRGVSAGLILLDELQGVLGDTATLRLARANLYAKDPLRLRPIGELLRGLERWSEADQDRFLYGLIEIHDRLGDTAATLPLLRRVAGRSPNDRLIWTQLAKRALTAGDQTLFEEARRNVNRIEGSEGSTELLFQAWESLHTGKTPSAFYESLVRKWGPWPDRADVCLTMAQLLAGTDDSRRVLQLYARAVQLEPTKYEYTQAHALYFVKEKQDAPLFRKFSRLMADPRWSGEPLQRLVRETIKAAEPDQIGKFVQQYLSLMGRMPWNQSCLGEALLQAGRKEEAVAILEQTVKSPRSTTDDWLRLIQIQPKAIEEAEKALSESALASVAASLAELPDRKGALPELKTPAALRQFHQARLSILQARVDRMGIIQLLDSYLQSKTIPANDRAWATRHLSLVLAMRGEPADRKRAGELMTQMTIPSSLSIEEQRTFIGAMSTISRYLEGADRKAILLKAFSWAEAVAKKTELARDEFVVCRLERSLERPDESVKRLNRLLAKEPTNRDYLLAGLEVLIDAQHYETAKTFADRLYSLAPSEIRVLSAICRFEVAAGRPKRAMELIDQAIHNNIQNDLDPSRSTQLAELLDELARRPEIIKTGLARTLADKAVTLYESSLFDRPETMIALATLLAVLPTEGVDGASEGLARIEKLSRAVPSRIRAAAGVTVLRTVSGSERQFDRVRSWIDLAKKENPESTSVWLTEAEFCVLKQDYAGAEKAYEEVLKRDAFNVSALNNLAWILAPNPKASPRALDLIERASRETGLTGELLDTRARIRIAAKQLDLAQRDAEDALRQQRTPLRLFHLALALSEYRPARQDEAEKAFQKAREQGLNVKQVHPIDQATYRVFENTMK